MAELTESIPKPSAQAVNDVTWDFPLPRTHTGVALGNGNFGCLVWGDERLCLTVNRSDYWDHRGGDVIRGDISYADLVQRFREGATAAELAAAVRQERPLPFMPWNSSRLPCGRFEVSLQPGLILQRARLATGAGVLRIDAVDAHGQVYTLAVAMHMREHVLVLADPDGIIAGVEPHTAWEWNSKVLHEARFEPPEVVRESTVWGWLQALPEDPSLAALLAKSPGGYMLCVERGADNAAAQGEAEAAIRRCRNQGFQAFFGEIALWWQAYWQDVPQISLPDAFYQRFYRYALFKFAGATNPASTTPAGLQGPWGEEYQHTPWAGDYHFNVNIQQVYTLAFAANRPSHLLPLFDMLESPGFMATMRQNARRLLGIDDGLLLTHTVNDRGAQCGGICLGSILDPACGGWVAQLYWLYYRYTGDLDFLRERALPFITGMMNSFEAMLEQDGKEYVLPLAISAEYRQPDDSGSPSNCGRSPSSQLACIHMLLDALLEVSTLLGTEPKSSWRDIKSGLPPITAINDRIAIWDGQDLDICHRHHSHLSCIYPFDTLGKMTAGTRTIVENSIDHWIAKGMGEWSEWCYPWAAILQARMGFREGPRVLLDIWRRLYINEGLATVYLPRFRGLSNHRRADQLKPKATSEIMQLDGTMAGATALLEMLVHEHQGMIQVFPAVPEDWPDVSFERICLPGPVLISAVRSGGKTRRIEVEARAEMVLKIATTSTVFQYESSGECVRLPLALELVAGQKVSLVSRDE